jgi:hypothetical protein
MALFLILALLSQPPATAGPTDISRVTVSTPRAVVEIDTGKHKGEPWRVAWSPDGAALYVQTMQVDKAGNRTPGGHYQVPAAGGTLEQVRGEPDWASAYWTWKSAQSAPSAPAFKIELESKKELVRSTAAPRGGGLAGMGGDSTLASGPGEGPSSAATIAAAASMQNAIVNTMLLKGETVGQWINAPIVPGLTFGWAPAGARAIAYASKTGRIVLMDESGRKTEVKSKDARLPAWSEDGRRLAFVQQTGKKKYGLYVADLAF